MERALSFDEVIMMGGRGFKRHELHVGEKAVSCNPGLILKIGPDGTKATVSIAKGDPLLEAQAGRASEPQSKKFSLTKLKPDILIGFVEEGGDPASMAKRFGQIVDGAKAGNSHCLTAILRIASVFKDKGIQADAGDILLERFGDKDGVLLYLAIRCPSGAIRTKSVRRMAENNKEYLLELASKESGYPDTRMEAKKLLDGGV